MKHLYLFTLEIVPLEVGRTYEELPSHLTLMSRFSSDLSSHELSKIVQPLFAMTHPVPLVFGRTTKLGPKKVTAHMVTSAAEHQLHNNLRKTLDMVHVEYQYPEFTGDGHKSHVTARDGVQFAAGSELLAFAVYLIEVVDKKRLVQATFTLSAT